MSGEAAEQGATSQQGAQTAISSGLNAPDTLPPRPALPPNTGRLPQSSMPDLILDRRSYNWINIQRLILDCRSYDPVYGGSYAHWFQTRRFDRLRIVSLGRYKLYTEPIYGQLDPGANGLILSFWATCGRLVEQNRHIDGILPGQEGQAGDGGVYDFGQVDMWGNPGVHEKHLGKCDGQDVSDDEVADLLDLLFHNYAAQGYLP